MDTIETRKYEILKDDVKKNHGNPVYRIKALIDIPDHDVKAGDLGGYIASEENLSHEGNCWVGKKARVYASAKVTGNAIVTDHATVSGSTVIKDNATISEYGKVFENGVVCDQGCVSGAAKVYGNSIVDKMGVVMDHATVKDNARVHGLVYGRSYIIGNAFVGERGIVTDGAIIGDGAYVKNNVGYVFISNMYGYREDYTFYINDYSKELMIGFPVQTVTEEYFRKYAVKNWPIKRRIAYMCMRYMVKSVLQYYRKYKTIDDSVKSTEVI